MVQRPARPDMDEDIDDIMASIMRSEPVSESLPRKPLMQPLRRQKASQETPVVPPIHQQRIQPASVPRSAQKPKKQRKKRKTPSRKVVTVFFIIPLVLMLLAGSIYFLREPIASLLQPKPPFSQEIADNMGIPLYYPTKLPGTFKIELDSIVQPEKFVVVYALSSDDGKRININQQEQPSDITLDPLHAVLSNIREVDTKFGPVKIGVNEGTTNIANILTGETWIILNYPTDAVQDAAIIQIINSLES